MQKAGWRERQAGAGSCGYLQVRQSREKPRVATAGTILDGAGDLQGGRVDFASTLADRNPVTGVERCGRSTEELEVRCKRIGIKERHTP